MKCKQNHSTAPPHTLEWLQIKPWQQQEAVSMWGTGALTRCSCWCKMVQLRHKAAWRSLKTLHIHFNQMARQFCFWVSTQEKWKHVSTRWSVRKRSQQQYSQQPHTRNSTNATKCWMEKSGTLSQQDTIQQFKEHTSDTLCNVGEPQKHP